MPSHNFHKPPGIRKLGCVTPVFACITLMVGVRLSRIDTRSERQPHRSATSHADPQGQIMNVEQSQIRLALQSIATGGSLLPPVGPLAGVTSQGLPYAFGRSTGFRSLNT